MTAASQEPVVTGGVDTHADTIHVAVIDPAGARLGDREFPTTAAGYGAALRYLASFGTVERLGIEGTSSYGTGITRAAQQAQIAVVEVNRPDRSGRRRQGKSDPLDAYRAAEAAWSGRATAAAKTAETDAMSALQAARASAVKATTATMNQIRQLLMRAPDPIRDQHRTLNRARLITTLAQTDPDTSEHPDLMLALVTLARRHQQLTHEANLLQRRLATLAEAANPALTNLFGVGPISAAQLLITAGGNPDRLRTEASFAALCGTAPIPASSGKTQRHRLSRGGDRAANAALHIIAQHRTHHDPRTRAYVERLTERHKTPREILRILKRAIAREIFHTLTRPTPPQTGHLDLRPTRQALQLTLQQAATALNTYPVKISRAEHGNTDPDFTRRYQAWLTTQTL